MSKHTPGPWSAEPTPQSSYWDWKVNVSRFYIGIDTPHSEADARLIAAAPELLAALRSMVAAVDRQPRESALDGLADSAREVIAKATGWQP